MLACTGSVHLKTKRPWLRRFTKAEAAQANRNYANDMRVAEYVNWPMHTGSAVTESYLDMAVAEYDKPETYRGAIEMDSGAIGCRYLRYMSIMRDEYVRSKGIGDF